VVQSFVKEGLDKCDVSENKRFEGCEEIRGEKREGRARRLELKGMSESG
jgi:hypothetical protein